MNTPAHKSLPLKKAREARRQAKPESGFTTVDVLCLLVVVGLGLFVIWGIAAGAGEYDRCHPVSSPTGRLLCYSGGILVYQTPTYRNGGILCSSLGVEIKTIPGTSAAFCIEESRQRDVWDPPEPVREAER